MLVSMLGWTPEAHAAAPDLQAAAAEDRSVAVSAIKTSKSTAPKMEQYKGHATKWPSAGTASVDLPMGGDGLRQSGSTTVGDLPVTVTPLDGDGKALSRSAPGKAAEAPGKVRLSVVDRKLTEPTGSALAFQVGREDGKRGGAVRLRVDISSFSHAYGADWAWRLKATAVPECYLTTPTKQGCAAGKVVKSAVDGDAGVITFDVALDTASAATETVVALAASGSSTETGDFTKTDLKESSTWSAGGNSGDFTYSYPLQVPPVPSNLVPSVAFNYSSGAVDGQTAGSHTQPSEIGEGWSYSPGYIERTYRPCIQDNDNSPNWTMVTADLCWRLPNAQIMLNGKSSEIVLGSDNVWRLADDDGEKVELLTGATNNDIDGEHWKITTMDGTQYWFGLEDLPNGRTGTGSVMTAPVYSNRSNEPCYNSSAAISSRCNRQALRWMLDYVVDRNGNEISYWYGRTANNTAMFNDSTFTTGYYRELHLNRIEYGTRTTDAATVTAPARVVFNYGDRCVTTSCTTHNDTNWPDTPWDLVCTGTTCANNMSPSFFSTLRLESVQTQVLVNSSYSTVDKWTLEHTFPTPGDASAVLWLASISHTGYSDTSSIATPQVSFNGTLMQNRADYDAGASMQSHKKWRISQVLTETGKQIDVTYAANDVHCAAGDTPNPDNNPNRCFPQYYTNPSGDSGWSWWHKRIVSSVVETDRVGGSPAVATNYAYSTASTSTNVLWAHGDGAAVWGSSIDYRSWSDWRGYSDVTVTTGPATGTRSQMGYVYFRGLHGDRTDTGNRTVSLSPYSGSWSDQQQRAGHLMNEITYDQAGGTAERIVQYNPYGAETGTRTLTEAWAIPATFKSYINRTDNVTTYEVDDAGTMASRSGTVDTFDSRGRLVSRSDKGNVGVVDETCTLYAYAQNPGLYLYAFKQREQQYSGECDANGAATSTDLLYDHAWRFDGQTYGAAPLEGNISRDYVWNVDAVNGVTGEWVSIADNVVYDSYGRVTSSTDGENHTTATVFTDNADHLNTSKAVTVPGGLTTTTTFNVRRSLPLAITDANSNVTTATYDALGRLLTVKKPGNTSSTPNVTYAYSNSRDAAPWIKTTTLGPNGGNVYTFEIYDGLLRPRQTQTTTADGKRMITDTQYDGRGLAVKVTTFYNAESGPYSTLVAFADTGVDRQTRYTYDGRGRQLTDETWSQNVMKWYSVSSYGFHSVTTQPPIGGTATQERTDSLGNLVEKRQYQSFADYTELVAGDFTNDGKNDLFGIRPGSDRRIRFVGNGDGTFVPNTGSATTGWSAYRNWVSGNFDTAGNLDLIGIRKSDGVLMRYQGDGTGGFPSSAQVGAGFSGYSELAAGDFDGDGLTDLVEIRSSDGMLQYSHSKSTGGAFDTPVDVSTGWSGYEHLVAGDANGDGKVDLLAIRSSDHVLRRWLGNGNGTFAAGTDVSTGWKRANLAAGDFTGDGKLDLFGAFPQDQGDIHLKRWAGDNTTFTSMGSLVATNGQAWDSTTYTYDRRNQLTSTKGPDGATWTYTYDLLGRKVQSVDPDTGTSTTKYDKVNNVISATDGRGQLLTYSYDGLARKTAMYKDAGKTAAGQLASWTYYPSGTTGKAGQLATATRYVGGNQVGGSAYVQSITSYNADYQPAHVDVTVPAAEGALANTYGFDYTYMNNGQPNTVVSPAAGGLPAETLTYGYGAFGHLTSLVAGSTRIIDSQTYTYDGQVYQQLLGTSGKQVRHTFSYEASTGRLLTSQLDTQNQTTPTTWDDKTTDSYAFDDAGNVRSIATKNTGTQDQAECVTYDGLRRMTQAWTVSTSSCSNGPQKAGVDPYRLSWTFDLAGNRKTETGYNADGSVDYLSTYTYGGTGKPLHSLASVVTTGTGASTKTYNYDAAGNTTSRPAPGGSQQTLSWTEDGKLSLVDDSSDTSMVYDANGNRMIRVEPGGYRTLYLPDGSELRANSTGAVAATRYYGGVAVRSANTDSSGNLTSGTTLTWTIADHHGTGSIVVDSSTLSCQRRRSTPFGTARGSQPNGFGSKGFVGGTNDPTGLVHVGAREYDPVLGRFISVDPIYDLGDPQSWNGYAYANNAPATRSDPSGTYAVDDSEANPGSHSSQSWDPKSVVAGLRQSEENAKREENENANKPTVTVCTATSVCVISPDGKAGPTVYNCNGVGACIIRNGGLGPKTKYYCNVQNSCDLTGSPYGAVGTLVCRANPCLLTPKPQRTLCQREPGSLACTWDHFTSWDYLGKVANGAEAGATAGGIAGCAVGVWALGVGCLVLGEPGAMIGAVVGALSATALAGKEYGEEDSKVTWIDGACGTPSTSPCNPGSPEVFTS
ncbi:FG-GAP-like repeat-containing protein [Hamadaea flava]|nr:FG-GAP-like repeat-containing protein [Hamadaea flava]